MLINRSLPLALVLATLAVPALAQEMAPHRAVYTVSPMERGKPISTASIGTYAYELRLTCEGYTVNQRMRIEIEGGRTPIVSEQQSQMTESRDGKKFHFEHRSTANGKQTSLFKGDALLDGNIGQARFVDPEGQSVALPADTMFPVSMARITLQRAKAGDTGFDGLFFFGDKAKPPQSANVLIGKVPKRLANLPIPEGAGALVEGHERIYFRGGFFESGAKGQGEPAFEMSSVTLDNGIELYGTNEQADTAIEYKLTRLEALPKPTCN